MSDASLFQLAGRISAPQRQHGILGVLVPVDDVGAHDAPNHLADTAFVHDIAGPHPRPVVSGCHLGDQERPVVPAAVPMGVAGGDDRSGASTIEAIEEGVALPSRDARRPIVVGIGGLELLMHRNEGARARCLGGGLDQVVPNALQGARTFTLDGRVSDDDAQTGNVDVAHVPLESEVSRADGVGERHRTAIGVVVPRQQRHRHLGVAIDEVAEQREVIRAAVMGGIAFDHDVLGPPGCRGIERVVGGSEGEGVGVIGAIPHPLRRPEVVRAEVKV